MVIKDDELELACCMENTCRVERGCGWLGERKKEIFYIENSLVPVGNTNRD
jgi:hypothetical protein